jgi:hypothetical protein
MNKFERGIDPKETLRIGKIKDAFIVVSMSRYYVDRKKGKHTSSSWSVENLDPILRDLENCKLPEYKMPHKKDQHHKVYDITFHVILPNGRRDDLRPFLLSGLTLSWRSTPDDKNNFYEIPPPNDLRWEERNKNIKT